MPTQVDCKHENTSEILVDMIVNPDSVHDKRKYEVVACHDCGRLVNYWTEDEGECMSSAEIVQLFVDIHDEISYTAAEALAQVQALSNFSEKLLKAMPKAKK